MKEDSTISVRGRLFIDKLFRFLVFPVLAPERPKFLVTIVAQIACRQRCQPPVFPSLQTRAARYCVPGLLCFLALVPFSLFTDGGNVTLSDWRPPSTAADHRF